VLQCNENAQWMVVPFSEITHFLIVKSEKPLKYR